MPVPGKGEDGARDSVNNEAASECLGVLLVVAVGARNGKRPALPKLDGVDVAVDSETSKEFSSLLERLQAYSQVSMFADGKGYREIDSQCCLSLCRCNALAVLTEGEQVYKA